MTRPADPVRPDTTRPLPRGTRVYHAAQLWARALPGGTAEILRAEGPDRLGDYEYLVRTGGDFSRQPGPDNPQTRETWWPSYYTHPADTEDTQP